MLMALGESHVMAMAGCREPASEWSVRYSPASRMELMLVTMEGLECDATS